MILSEKEFTYLLALRSAPHVGNVISRRLIEYFGSAEKLFNLSARDLRQVKGIGTQLSSWLHDRTALVARAKEELERMRDSDIRGIHYYEDRYPLRLRSCFDAPLILFYRGDLDCLQGPSVGVVGTRKATPYGVRQTEELLAGLVDLKPTVVSGLAYGIDIAAHRSALHHSIPTVAVLAHGLDRIYPSAHIPEVEMLLEQGGLVMSEYTMGTLPDQMNFPSRNRIIAGLSDALLVMEARSKGGALVTAGIAFDYDRSVYALPGRLTDISSQGTNSLIASQKAQLLLGAEQLMRDMNWDHEERKYRVHQIRIELFSVEEQEIIRLLSDHSSMGLDQISDQLGRPVPALSGLILQLELRGAIRQMPGNRYAIN